MSEPSDPLSEPTEPPGEPSESPGEPGDPLSEPTESPGEPSDQLSEPPSEPPTEPGSGTVADPDPGLQRDALAPSPVPSVASTAQQGPLGKPRGVLFVILISIITFGIYHLYWVYKVYAEMKDHTGEGVGGVLGLVIAIIINPINWFVMPSEVGKMYRRDGQSAPMTGWTGLWMILPIVGWFVWTVKIQRALNRYWERRALLV